MCIQVKFAVFVLYFDIVVRFIPNCSIRYLFVRVFSANAALVYIFYLYYIMICFECKNSVSGIKQEVCLTFLKCNLCLTSILYLHFHRFDATD